MMKEEIKQRLQTTQTWTRALFMLLFFFIQGMVKFLVVAVSLFQFGAITITGQTNKQLLWLGRQLAVYEYQIIYFLTFNSELRPFPFSTWPSDLPESQASTKQNDQPSSQ